MYSLEFMAMVWLRVQKGCVIVTCERCLRHWAGQPDVLGITKSRHMIEFEVKRSVADFRADSRKHHRKCRDKFIDLQPKQFYYLMPPELASRLVNEIPAWAGLATSDEKGFEIKIVKVAPTNKESKRLSLNECVRAVVHQTNFILGLVKGRQLAMEQIRHNYNMELRPNPELHFEI